jgi:hypothetical protein
VNVREVRRLLRTQGVFMHDDEAVEAAAQLTGATAAAE